MKFYRLASAIGGMGLLAGGLSSCLKAPEYSTTPSISFNQIQRRRYTPTNVKEQVLDTISIKINYQDGDGDLGLTADEVAAQPTKYSGRFAKNYFIEPFVKNKATGKYEALTTVGVPFPNVYNAGQYNGLYLHPTASTDTKAAPIKGTLTYTLIPFGLGDIFVPGQTVRFQVSIADRALNVSNTIMTDSVVIPPR
ncbi:hypothetical protein [Hymenobacter cheonanensis]|uniref:hypothetical protein n=1 Tax=Hymenobacter sp. CA2-7 TaxID=3063993 RepID=UPI00271324C1|nr:hypothetical protein [Hymenobacter sp. CA2-7]MDO7884169.1 hypothetical protein [Hymenobacter sp. CA2-7]